MGLGVTSMLSQVATVLKEGDGFWISIRLIARGAASGCRVRTPCFERV
jgi:hypothetical protein